MRSNIEGALLYNNMLEGKNRIRRTVKTLGTTNVLDDDADHLQFLDPGGAARTLVLPAESPGLWFFIRNTADAAELITVVEDAGLVTIGTIPQNSGAWFFCDGTTWFSTGASGQGSSGLVTVTAATLTVTPELHAGRTVVLSKVDGQAVTLPAATGSGNKYNFVVGLTITSVGTTIKVVGDDIMQGLALGLDGDGVPANAWATAADSDTVTMDGSTQGGVVGDRVELEDIAANTWAVQVRLQQSGTEATPFSASVTP